MPAIKLTKSEQERLEKLQERLEEVSQKFSEAVDTYNQALAKLNAPLSEVFEAYKQAVNKVAEFAERVSERVSSAIEERTEEWQDSDDGIASIELRDAWADFHHSVKDYVDPTLTLPEEVETPELLSENLSLNDLPQDAND